MSGRLGEGGSGRQAPIIPGVRVILDARPLQDPDGAPTTATYLAELVAAFAADPLPGESFALLLQAGLDDPTATRELASLVVVGRRLLPPTRLFRAGALTIDPLLLRGASLGAAWRAEAGGAAGSVYHAAGGVAPLASGVPVVVTLLDLAPWELPDSYQATTAARFGQRLRARILRDATAVIVGSAAAARAARRLLRLRRDRIRIVPLAPRRPFTPAAGARSAAEVARLGLPERYLVYPGRYDARHDLGTLLRALASLARRPVDPDGPRQGDGARGPTAGLSSVVPWPPRLVLVGASPADRAALARAAAREGVGDLVSYAPYLSTDRLAAIIGGARAVVLPALSEYAGLSAIEALACGTPVVASAVGALPELVAGAGILVEPRDPHRLAVALAAAWSDEAVHSRLVAEAQARAAAAGRSWSDVARETRTVYAEVARPSIG